MIAIVLVRSAPPADTFKIAPMRHRWAAGEGAIPPCACHWCPTWPKAGPGRIGRRPVFRRLPIYAATVISSGSEFAMSTSSGNSIGRATGIVHRIINDALFAASCNDLADRWAYLWVTDGSPMSFLAPWMLHVWCQTTGHQTNSHNHHQEGSRGPDLGHAWATDGPWKM